MVPFEEQYTSKFFQEVLRQNIILLDVFTVKTNIIVNNWKLVTIKIAPSQMLHAVTFQRLKNPKEGVDS